MELHLYELLKLMKKSLRPGFDCGFGSQIFSSEEIHNFNSGKRLKTVKTLRLRTRQQKAPKFLNVLVTLDKNNAGEILVIKDCSSKHST